MKKKFLLSINNLLAFLIIFINCILIYIERYFGEISFSQLIFHLNISNNLLLDSDEYIIEKLYQICIYLPLTIYLFSISLILITKKYFIFFNKIFKNNFILFFLIFLSLLTIINFQKKIKFGNFIFKTKEDIIKKYYVDPKNIKYDFKESKNLVLIYMESYENLFSDQNIFNENLIKKITDYKHDSPTFDKFVQTSLTNWTIASIVATQCGLPLKNYGIFNFGNKKGKHMRQVFGLKDFLPNAFCLGDILKQNNFKNIFVSSPNTTFSGTGKFFFSHGYDEIYGKEKFDELNIDYKGSSWGGGPHDSFLFDFSKKKIIKMLEKNQKFSINILTTDIHEPNGFLDPDCEYKINTINNIIKCTSNELLKFLTFLEKNYKDKLNIVIIGDHLFRFGKNDIKEILPKERTIFNKFISQNNNDFNREKILHYDLLPTIIDFLDIDYDGSELGIGISGYDKINKNQYDKRSNKIKDNILNKSKFYENFWK